MSSHRLPYRPDWDGLRAIAILLVVLCHAELCCPGGFIGVDMFFVLSGFLISKLILKDLEQGTFSIVQFCERRFRRIVPALVVVTFSTLIAGLQIMSPEAYYDLGQSALSVVGMVSNFYFWWDTGYFAEDAEYKPLLHTWSLGIEEQFYFLIAIGFLLLAKFGRVKQFGWWVALASIGSLGISIFSASHGAASAFFLLPSRFWELGAGSLLALVPAFGLPRLVREVLGVTGLIILLWCGVNYDGQMAFPGWAAIPPVVATVLLLCPRKEEAGPTVIQQILAMPPLVFLGKISYPLYLWHWPLMAFLNYRSFEPASAEERLGVLALSLCLSIFTYFVVEIPFRSGLIFGQTGRFLRLAPIMGLLLLSAGWFLVEDAKGKMDGGLEWDIILATTRREEKYMPCHNPGQDIATMPKYGDENAQPKIVLWGDSHAMAVLPAIESLCESKGTAVLAATRFLTPPLKDFQSSEDTFNQLVLEYLQTNTIHTVILGGHWSSYLDSETQQTSLLETVDTLQALGIRVAFLKDVPEFNYHVPRIMALNTTRKFDVNRLGVTRAHYKSANFYCEGVIPELEKRGVIILDPIRYFESDENRDLLLPFDETGVFYRDADHLSTHGAMTIKDIFAPVFEDLN